MTYKPLKRETTTTFIYRHPKCVSKRVYCSV